MAQEIRYKFVGQRLCIEASLNMEISFTCFFSKCTVKHVLEIGRSLSNHEVSSKNKKKLKKYFKQMIELV